MTQPEQPNLEDAVQQLNRNNADLEHLCGAVVELEEQLSGVDDLDEHAEMLRKRLDELVERYKKAYTAVDVVANACGHRLEQIENDSRWAPTNPANVQVNAPLALQQTSMEARHNTFRYLLGRDGFGGGLEPLENNDD